VFIRKSVRRYSLLYNVVCAFVILIVHLLVIIKIIQSTIHTSSELCKNASLVIYLVQTVIHIQSVHSQVCVYITL
jgi:hypothetical protein